MREAHKEAEAKQSSDEEMDSQKVQRDQQSEQCEVSDPELWADGYYGARRDMDEERRDDGLMEF